MHPDLPAPFDAQTLASARPESLGLQCMAETQSRSEPGIRFAYSLRDRDGNESRLWGGLIGHRHSGIVEYALSHSDAARMPHPEWDAISSQEASESARNGGQYLRVKPSTESIASALRPNALFCIETISLTSAKSSKVTVLVDFSFFCIRSEGKTPYLWRIYIIFGVFPYKFLRYDFNINHFKFTMQ